MLEPAYVNEMTNGPVGFAYVSEMVEPMVVVQQPLALPTPGRVALVATLGAATAIALLNNPKVTRRRLLVPVCVRT